MIFSANRRHHYYYYDYVLLINQTRAEPQCRLNRFFRFLKFDHEGFCLYIITRSFSFWKMFAIRWCAMRCDAMPWHRRKFCYAAKDHDIGPLKLLCELFKSNSCPSVRPFHLFDLNCNGVGSLVRTQFSRSRSTSVSRTHFVFFVFFCMTIAAIYDSAVNFFIASHFFFVVVLLFWFNCFLMIDMASYMPVLYYAMVS